MKKIILGARGAFLCSLGLSALDVVCTAYYPLLLSWIIDNFDSLSGQALSLVFLSFIGSVGMILLVQYLNKIAKVRYEKAVCQGLRRDLFAGFIRMDYTTFHAQKKEDYASFLISNVEQLYRDYFENFIYLTDSVLMLAIYCVILLLVSWQMCAVIFLSLGLLLVVPRLVGGQFKNLNTSLTRSRADYLSRCEELFDAYDLIDSQNIRQVEELYAQQLGAMQNANSRLGRYQSFVQIFSGSTLYVQLILCFCVGAALAYSGVITLGVFTSSLLYVEYVSARSANIVDEILEIKSSRIHREQCVKILAQEKKSEKGERPFENLRLENVCYEIPGQELLHNVSLEFIKGKKYLIVGENGAGKSTLLKLIGGFLPPAGGRVLYNGKPGFSRTEVGYVPQRRYVFEGSLLDNITLFAEKVWPEDRARMEELCRRVHLNYPLEHPIRRNGENLSGGEMAKICLLRELYKNRGMLLIDEPFNDIDAASAEDILDLILSLDAAVILVAHNLGRTANFDAVLRVGNGTVTCAHA